MKNNKGLLIAIILLAILAIGSIVLNIVLISSNSTKDVEEAPNQGVSISSLINLDTVDLSEFEKKSYSGENVQTPYVLYSRNTNLFDAGVEETLNIKQVEGKNSFAKITIKNIDKTKTVNEIITSIISKMENANHVVEIMQISTVINGKTEKVEDLSENNIAGADRINVSLRVHQDIKEIVPIINITVSKNKNSTYDITVNYYYEKPTSSKPQGSTDDGHNHDHATEVTQPTENTVVPTENETVNG